jgi:hypothetical protein
MIRMYERTIWYYNVCLSVQDHIIIFLLQSQVIGFETSNSESKGNHFGTQEKLLRLRRWYEERSTKS